jgi:Succinylglutamate desuccinylase / Aspartoacylase family
MSALRQIERPDPAAIPSDPLAFLSELGGPTAIHVPGRDPSRLRVVTTLLHGNEPSGLRAIVAWLRQPSTPAVDALLIVANVAAALAAPGFGHRMLPGRRDLNRCFLGPFDDPDGALAREILALIGGRASEALIDLHNNTGHNPAYGVGVDPSPAALSLVSLFGRRFVWSQLRLGALMEAIPGRVGVTIEVGRSGDPRADAVALEGLRRFLDREALFEAARPGAVEVLMMPMRVCLRPGVDLVISDARDPEVALTILADLDRHNFERMEEGTPIGWSRDGRLPVELLDAEGRDRAPEYFALEGHLMRTRRPLIPIMITTDPTAAKSDCLFYVVQEAAPALPPGRIPG